MVTFHDGDISRTQLLTLLGKAQDTPRELTEDDKKRIRELFKNDSSPFLNIVPPEVVEQALASNAALPRPGDDRTGFVYTNPFKRVEEAVREHLDKVKQDKRVIEAIMEHRANASRMLT